MGREAAVESCCLGRYIRDRNSSQNVTGKHHNHLATVVDELTSSFYVVCQLGKPACVILMLTWASAREKQPRGDGVSEHRTEA